MLEVKNLSVYHGYVHAVKDVTFKVKEGELMAILGANGAGKSTLLSTVAGLNSPSGGEILLKGKSITGQTPESIMRQGISLIPEKREIFGNLTVMDNLILGAFHRYRRNKASVFSDAENVLKYFPALIGREKDLASTLSGGLQQMLAIGRGLMAKPLLLLLDEPSVGLAPMIVKEIMNILLKLKETGVTIILVEQNMKAALKVADEILVLERGRITLTGSSDKVISDAAFREAYLGKKL